MKNWSTNEQAFQKNSTAHTRWRLQQLINFGLDGEKLDANVVRQHWASLDIDPWRRRLLERFLYGKKNTHG